MPTYSYKCRSCDNAFDIHQKFTDDALTECPACGGDLRKLFNSVGVVFKGSGFYRNDSRAGSGSSGSGGASGGESSGSASSDSNSSSSSSSGSSSSSASSASSSGSSSSSSTKTSGSSGSSAS